MGALKEMSRRPPRIPAPPAAGARDSRGLRGAACFGLLLTGCAVWWPIVEEKRNEDPVIEFSSPAEDATLEIAVETVRPFVIASDEDGDTLEFFWSVSGLGLMGSVPMQAGESQYGSMVELDRDEVYDGRELTCVVTDGQRGQDQRSWLIEVLEEVR